MPPIDMSPLGRGRVVVTSTLVTLACIVFSWVVNSLGLTGMDQTNWPLRVGVSVLMPIAIAFPVMWFLMSKLRELAIAHRDLQIVASSDSLTAVLNRGAFTMLVEAYLTDVRDRGADTQGALLIVDADHFKDVNDTFGHDQGDVALKLIAQTLRDTVREPDLVGRLGGEEFGVFLHGADMAKAEQVAERIRIAVNVADFRPDGKRRQLSVSVGGATFARPVQFEGLFRAADRALYRAKELGRNRTTVMPLPAMAAAA